MHGDGYETGQVPLLHVFVRTFGLDPAQNTPFFERITNQILRLNYAQLICEPVRSENKTGLCRVTVNSTSIATTLFPLLKVLSFHNQSLINYAIMNSLIRSSEERLSCFDCKLFR